MMGQPVSLLIAFGAGLISFFSPCVLPLVGIAYVSFITGVSIRELKDSQTKVQSSKKILVNTLLFILGFSTIFCALGASATYFGQFFIANQRILKLAGGILVIGFGLYIAGYGLYLAKRLDLEHVQYKKKLRFSGRSANILGSFVVGMAFAGAWTPCVGPILGSILAYAAVQKTVSQGVVLLGSYSLGLSVPFLITSLAINTFLGFFKKVRRHFGVISVVSGALLILVGIFILR